MTTAHGRVLEFHEYVVLQHKQQNQCFKAACVAMRALTIALCPEGLRPLFLFLLPVSLLILSP